MAVRNSESRWGSLAQFLHWGVALLIGGLLPIGFIMTGAFEDDLQTKFAVYQLHKSFGLTVLALVIVRIFWRLVNPTPADPPGMPGWQRVLSRISHYGLYAALILMPVSGWLRVSSEDVFRIDTEYFGLFVVPHLTGPDDERAHFFHEMHEVTAFLIIALLLLHVAGALYHHFIVQDHVLRRMMPGTKSID